METKTKSAINEYEKACNEIIDIFCKKHGVSFELWVADDIGSIALISDCFLDFQDIITDLKENIPNDVFWDWYDGSLANLGDREEFESRYRMNYGTYLKQLK